MTRALTWKPEFTDRFIEFVKVIARAVNNEVEDVPFYTPINEMSFVAWNGGDVEYLNPFARGRGGELKRILVRSTIAAIEAIRDIDPRARFVTAEPLIHIFPKSDSRVDVAVAAAHNEAQFEATDLLCGRAELELGGRPGYLDILGMNYYYTNQWIDHARTIYLGDGMYRPLSELLEQAYRRYERPFFIAETGTEAGGRAPWLHYVCDEVRDAKAAGVPVDGICIYPILNHRGWDDDRHCHNGMFCGIEGNGSRTVASKMELELSRQQAAFSHP